MGKPRRPPREPQDEKRPRGDRARGNPTQPFLEPNSTAKPNGFPSQPVQEETAAGYTHTTTHTHTGLGAWNLPSAAGRSQWGPHPLFMITSMELIALGNIEQQLGKTCSRYSDMRSADTALTTKWGAQCHSSRVAQGGRARTSRKEGAERAHGSERRSWEGAHGRLRLRPGRADTL